MKDDARLGIFVSRGDDAVPNVGRIDHTRHRRLFDSAISEVGSFKSELVGECRGRAVGTAINNIIRAGHANRIPAVSTARP